MDRFINRDDELRFLDGQYSMDAASLVIVYGRRRVGKTSLIHRFAQDKPFVYFFATEESEHQNIRMLKTQISDFTNDVLLAQAEVDNWDILFQTLIKHQIDKRLVLVIDEFQYLGKTNPAFPSIFQRIWDTHLKNANLMVILCGSLIQMMESQTLNYNSPLYGRRTGQIKLRQIDFLHYPEFFCDIPYKDLIELYAVTGGTPKYIELFNVDGGADIYANIESNILNKQSLLFEEPIFLLQNEVKEIGSYFSIIRSIAAGNHKLSKICADLGVKQTSMPKYLKTLIDLDILEREVPVTESNPDKSKMGQYRINDNFLSFWFKFVYPEKARLELSDTLSVIEKIRANFIDNHVAYVYEAICRSEMWKLAQRGLLKFNKLGRWWNNKVEIDIVGIDTSGNDIVFGECKYRSKPMDTDVFETLLAKKDSVQWKNDSRIEHYVLFSISGYTDRLLNLETKRDDLILFHHR